MARCDASDLAHRLGRQAEAVCRHYLSAGRRHGAYWQVGDVRNTPGRSMFVRLRDSPRGPAGKWLDAATGERGDLLDVIRETRGFTHFADVAEEARRFLSLPHPGTLPAPSRHESDHARFGSPEAARRLLRMSQPIGGTLVEAYLRNRGITNLSATGNLRFHPRCWWRPDDDGPTRAWPAMIAAVTDPAGRITGAHRTWLASDGSDKAPIATPRKAMGNLLGNAVRFGVADDVMAAGEGIETVLSVRQALPTLGAAAVLSANHLAAMLFPTALRRLYIVRDDDPAGNRARDRLVERANVVGIEAVTLSPVLGDFNEDLRIFGTAALRAWLRHRLVPQDVARFMARAA